MNHLTAETVRKEREEYLRQEAIEKEIKRHKFERDVERIIKGELNSVEIEHFAKLRESLVKSGEAITPVKYRAHAMHRMGYWVLGDWIKWDIYLEKPPFWERHKAEDVFGREFLEPVTINE